MGKKIIGVIAFAAIAAVAGWNYQQNKNEVQLSDLALENVEASLLQHRTAPCPRLPRHGGISSGCRRCASSFSRNEAVR